MFFTIVFIKKNKNKKIEPQEIEKNIASMPLNRFFDCLSYKKKDAIWCLFKINDNNKKAIKRKQIWIKKEYILLKDIIKRPEPKKIVYLRFINLEKNNKAKKKTFWV